MTPEVFANSRGGKLPNTRGRNGGFRGGEVGTVHAVIVYELGPEMVPQSPRFVGLPPMAISPGPTGFTVRLLQSLIRSLFALRLRA